MIVDAAHFSDGEFEEDIDGSTASCREHKNINICGCIYLLKYKKY